MPAPIAIFAFNRPVHLRRTLEALAANELAAESHVTFFCDGPRTAEEKIKTDAVRAIARAAQGFASIKVVERAQNMGLASNLIAGITEVVNGYGQVIVLEDDLLTSPYFLRYMNDGLNLYVDNSEVASIVGWCFPHTIQNPPETFFLRGADCWGWGTWQRAWQGLQTDGQKLLDQIKQQKIERTFNADNSYDYIQLLQDTIDKKVSSWAILWHASMFIQNKVSLFPSKSLIYNKGFDSGTHFHKASVEQTALSAIACIVKKIPFVENTDMVTARNRWLLSTDKRNNLFTKIYRYIKYHFPLYYSWIKYLRDKIKNYE